MNKKTLILGSLALLLMGAIFLSGCTQEEEKPGCPHECCTGETYKPRACPIGYECRENVCVGVGDAGKEKIEEKDETIKSPEVTQLTSLEYAIDPDWSPEGKKIVFCSLEGETKTLYSINSDGTSLTEIGPGFDPSWSPTEDKIAYELDKQIYIMDSSGGDVTQLTTEHSNGQPAWNPDGTKIAYAHYGGEEPSIWVMDADGSGKTQLTAPTGGECTFPSFSYDGSKIVYIKGYIWDPLSEKLPKSPNEIWVMNSDGSNKHQIYAPADTYQWIFQRAWNKNDEILFAMSPLQEGKIPEIGIIDSDGSKLRYILAPPRNYLGMPECIYLDPVWDSSGSKIAVTKQAIGGATNIGTVSWEE